MTPYVSPARLRDVVTIIILIFFSISWAEKCVAQEVALKNTIDNWSIYCLKDVRDELLKPQDCSLVTAAVGTINKNAWVRVGITQASPQEMQMTIRIPRLDYFKKGISISNQNGQ